MSVLAATLFAGSSILSSQSARRKRRAARMRQQITKIRNFQQSRAFMNKFYQAQGQAMAAGAVSGAGLGSSGVQGQLASQATQARVGMQEFGEMGDLEASANQTYAKASRMAGYGSLLQSAGNIAMIDFSS